MAAMESVWPTQQGEMNAKRATVYWEVLNSLDDTVFVQAVVQILKTATFFPTPAAIWKSAQDVLTDAGLLPPDSEEGWIQVEQLAQNKRHKDEVDPLVYELVREMGGRQKFQMATDEEMSFHRTFFMDAYGKRRDKAIESDSAIMSQSLPLAENVSQLKAGK